MVVCATPLPTSPQRGEEEEKPDRLVDASSYSSPPSGGEARRGGEMVVCTTPLPTSPPDGGEEEENDASPHLGRSTR